MGDNRRTKRFLDLSSRVKGSDFVDYSKFRKSAKDIRFGRCNATLFSHGWRKELFIGGLRLDCEFSRRSPYENRINFSLDSAYSRMVSIAENKRILRDEIFEFFREKYSGARDSLLNLPEMLRSGISPIGIWKTSLIGAVLFGMISMAMIYRYLGQGVSAESPSESGAFLASRGGEMKEAKEQVLGVETMKLQDANQLSDENVEYISNVLDALENSKKEELKDEIRKMVKGYPIEAMVPLIAEKDRIVAAFLIGIARKESSWGLHVPVLNGQDCFNYWGYRAQRERMGTGGHTCFNNRKDAIDTVAKRLEWLINNKKLNTPAKMSIWKCGSNCSSDSQVGKWISDVNLYFYRLNK